MVDRAVPRIRPKDPDLARVQDNLANAVQQLLDANNSPAGRQAITQAILAPVMQQLGGAGTAQSVKTPALQIKGRPDGAWAIGQPTVTMGEPPYTNAAGQPVTQRDAEFNLYGQINAFGSRVNADNFILIPYVSGVAFRITPNNASNAFVVNTDGTVTTAGAITTPSIVSNAGLPEPVFMGTYYNSSNPATTPKQTTYTVYNDNGGGVTTMGAYFKPMRAGSLVGFSYRQEVSGAGQNTMYVYKNGSQLYAVQTVSGPGTLSGTLSKGAYPFAANDEITVKVMGTTASQPFCASVQLMIEMAS